MRGDVSQRSSQEEEQQQTCSTYNLACHSNGNAQLEAAAEPVGLNHDEKLTSTGFEVKGDGRHLARTVTVRGL